MRPAGGHAIGSEHETFSSRTLLNEMISSMREGIIMVERGGLISASNPAARDLFGHGENIETQKITEIIPDGTVQEAFLKALESGERTEMQVEIFVHNDNRVYDLRVGPLSFAEKKNERSALGIFYDITRLERLERVRQEFLSNVSHELRTPLTSILAFVETLADGALEDKENNFRFLDVIRRNAERMHHLIDDILELSAIEAGKTQVRPRKFRLYPLVEDIWSSLSEKSQSKPNITFANDVPVDTVVFADPRRLEQILTNLISNAVKFNREGGSVSVSHELTDGMHRIRVTDTGEGIAPEHLPRIFERFYRTDTARSRELGGTGLGLAIVKHLARLHGGEARVGSTLGNGSIFTVDLPAPK
jgi:two-component system phosphate regulon sensor histidine kinase PhoR